MRGGREPSCRSCPTHRSCGRGDETGGEPAAGWRLVGMATGYFLWPLAAAIVAAAAFGPGTPGILAGLSALAGALVAITAAAALLRRRTGKQRSCPL